MRVLIVGGGGREHALAWALSHGDADLLVAPGNAGTAAVARNVPMPADDIPGLVDLAERERVDLVVVGPEAPLVAGLVDRLHARGIRAFGPTAEAARLEGSKSWARALCDRHGIPGPIGRRFDDLTEAMASLDGLGPPWVVKADGLAAGKGVTVTSDRQTAVRALEDALVRRVFGEAGATVLVEECLEGPEVSALALTDGTSLVTLPLARDHKRALDGDRGPNTGGMGAYSPVPAVDPGTERAIITEILEATVRALAAEGITYRGVLYAGLMLTAGGPRVLEFNCRFGDPETQVLLPRLADPGSLLTALAACAEGDLGGLTLEWSERACVGVVLASGGYPGPVEDGKPIEGLDVAGGMEGVEVFHAGTVVRDGRVVSAGGRVLTVSALGSDLRSARALAYRACSPVRFEGMTHRRDIGAQGGGGDVG